MREKTRSFERQVMKSIGEEKRILKKFHKINQFVTDKLPAMHYYMYILYLTLTHFLLNKSIAPFSLFFIQTYSYAKWNVKIITQKDFFLQPQTQNKRKYTEIIIINNIKYSVYINLISAQFIHGNLIYVWQ